MADPILFFFDYSSPYGYLASEAIDAVAAKHGRTVAWKPFLMGAVFKEIGTRPLVEVPLKGDYTRRDMARSARALGIPFVTPPGFPFLSVAACRASYWAQDRDPAKARALMQALLRRAWAEGGDISKPESVLEVAVAQGFPRDELAAALQDPAVKERLRQEVETALKLGVFGSPFFLVDGEPFWGHDRLGTLDRWLAAGGW